jgi:hypothetical protein
LWSSKIQGPMDWWGIGSRCLRHILAQLLSLANTADASGTLISAAHHLLRYPSPSTGDGEVGPPPQCSWAEWCFLEMEGGSLVAQRGSNGVEYFLFRGGECRMDLPGPITSVGTRTNYSVGPWDYSTCAPRHLMAWSTRTTKEKYSDRKLYKSRPV